MAGKVFRTALFCLLAGSGSACGKDSPVQPTSHGTVMTRLEVTGPDSVAPGGTVQLVATAHLSDGTARVVTNEASWDALNGGLVVTGKGRISAGDARGEGVIIVTYDGHPGVRSDTGWVRRNLYVLPPGTFLLYGMVKDSGVLVNGARVELTDGNMAGAEVVANGFFRFYGVAGATAIRVSKEGYDTTTRQVVVSGHHTEEIALLLSGVRLTAEGVYSLTISAAQECRSRLPETVWARTYRADVTQDGPRARVLLSGAELETPWGSADRFTGLVDASSLQFTLHGYGTEGPQQFWPASVMERIAALDLYVTFYGSVFARADGAGWAGPLAGTIAVMHVGAPWDYGDLYKVTNWCESSSHQFRLTR